MEHQAGQGNVRAKIDLAKDNSSSENVKDLTDLIARRTADGRRNAAAFVFTAQSGKVVTARAKTRLVFDNSEKVVKKSSKSSILKPESVNLEPESLNLRSEVLNLKSRSLEEGTSGEFAEFVWPPSESPAKRVRKRPGLRPLTTRFARMEEKDSLNVPEFGSGTWKYEVKGEAGSPFVKNAEDLANICGESAESLNSRSVRFEYGSSGLFREVSDENSVSSFRKRPQEALKPFKIAPRRVERRENLVSLPAVENSKQGLRNGEGTPDLKRTLEPEGDSQITNGKFPRRSSSFFPSRPSLSVKTPTSKFQRGRKLSLPSNRLRAEAASKLKAMENEHLHASRLAQARKDLWLDMQEKAYIAWLNFVLKQPMKANASKSHAVNSITVNTPSGNRGRYDSESSWRTPRQQMIRGLRGLAIDGSKSGDKFKSRLSQTISETCLLDVCTVAELRQRLEVYLNSPDVDDVMATMLKVAKYVEDGRFKMKEECAILTDVALKEKAIQVLMDYNPTWLRIGLYIVFGHDGLVTKERPNFTLNVNISGVNSEADSEFLKLIIEKQFFAHAGLSKSYASNKTIDGLYRPGYYEALGKVILKRFFLFVLALDKAKCQSTLPVGNGIDALDGGSPLLFCRNASAKSSRQVLQNFLQDVMHGEGDLPARLATIGYQVFHSQVPIADYYFHVINLIEDLRDGVILCRLIQLLVGDVSILMKILVPSDHFKKNLHNCTVALKYLLEAGVPLSDEEGYDLTADDLVMGEREKILSLLWNIFVQLQMPLLISKQQLCDEVIKIKGLEYFDLAISSNDASTTIDLMLKWTQAICATYDHAVEDFKLSFADGKSFLYLIDFYLPGYLPSHILKEPYVIETLDLMTKDSSYPKAFTHKYSIVEDAMKQLCKIPEVLQITDFLEGGPPCNERGVIILLTFLASQLLEGKPLAFSLKSRTASCNSEKIVPERCCKQIECRDGEHLAAIKIQSFYRSILQRRHYLKTLEGRNYIDKGLDFMVAHEKVAIQIQSCWRSFRERKQFLKLKASATTIQRAIRSWLYVKRENKIILHSIICSTIQGSIEEMAATTIQSHFKGFVERKQLLMVKSAALNLQRVIKTWLVARRMVIEEEAATTVQSHYRCFVQRKQFLMMKSAALYSQRVIRAWLVARCVVRQERASIVIQSHYRCFVQRKQFLTMKSAALYSQRVIRALLVARCMVRQENASIVIQSHYRGLIERRCFLKSKAAVLLLQTAVRVCIRAAQKRKCAQKVETAAIIIQSHIRGWLQRSRYILLVNNIRSIQSIYRAYKHKKELIKAALKIQCTWKRFIIQSQFSRLRFAATKIQSYWKGLLARNYYKEQKASAIVIQRCFRGYMCRERYKLFIETLIKVQSVIRGKMAVRTYLKYKTATLKLQHAFRNWLVRKDVQKLNASEAAINIERFYHGHAARLLYSSQKREHMTNAEDIIVRQDLDCFEHDVSISSSCKDRAKEIVRRRIQVVKQRQQFRKIRDSVLKLQSWWRKVLAHRSRSAVVIQSHIRGWFCRKNLSNLNSAVLVIQAYWRSYVVRRNQVSIKQELLSIRRRIQHSAANVDDSLRLENRLTKALEALLSHKTLSGILHTCATLDTATCHSKRCCERLVAAGAIDKLLQLISSTNRSAPHEEVLKHALSVLCNIAHYPELAQLVVDTPSSINTIAEQLLRNREEAFCKAAEILRKLCAVKGGVDAIRKLAPIIRRLQYLRQNLEKKVETEQRSLAKLPPKVPAATRKAGERRLREADSQCQLIVHILECVTGESGQRRSDVPKIRPQSDLLPKMGSTGSTDHTRRVSKGRNPFHDCSNH